MLLGIGNLLELTVHLLFFCLHTLALYTLIGSILPHKAYTAYHLRQVVGTEDKHQLVLRRTIAMHIAHRLHIILLVLLKFCLQQVELCEQQLYLHIERRDIMLDSVNGTTLALYLAIQNHQVVQTLLHVLLVIVQPTLLLLNLLLYLLTLLL